MKQTLSMLVTTLSFATLFSSCNLQTSSSSSNVSTGFSMTGSGLDVVARSGGNNFWSHLIPSAYALTPPPLLDASGQSVSLNEAWIVVKKIEFYSRERDDASSDHGFGSDNLKLRGPHFVNLLSDQPDVLEASLPASGVRRLKMELHQSDTIPADAPEGLRGNSIYFSGLVNGIQFSYSSSDNSEFKIRGPQAITPDSSKNMLAVIRIAGLFKQIDLSKITEIGSTTNISKLNRVPANNPCPLIDPESQDLYRCIRRGLESHARFGKDDGDSDLDHDDECVDDNENELDDASIDD
jgi:hypothetical protein